MSKYNDIDMNHWKEYTDVETDSLWLIDKRDNSGVHAGDYHGNFVPQIPHQLFSRYTKQGDWILDPFMGSGTSLIEAQRMKRNAIGIELQQEVLDKAQAEAEKIVADTKQEAKELLDKVQKEGYDAGYKDGKAEGIKDGKEKIEDELAEIVKQTNEKAQKTLRDAKELTAEYFIEAEDDIVKIVIMAIEKILPQHFLDAPQVILPVVREAINHVRDQKEIIIHVEPYSYDLILMARPEFKSMLTDGTATIEIVSDDALQPGDCVIETPNGGVDARLSTQLDLLKRAVRSVLNKQE